MNSYFASVEQQANPFLRGKPVGVCAYLSPNGTIIASSMEAKKKGVKTGCKVREAKIICPGIIFLENEPAKYRSTTEKIFKIFSEYTELLEPYSIDEAFLDLTGYIKNFSMAKKIALEIQLKIKKNVGEWLRCSIGISFTKFLAKFAGDIAPKGGIMEINNINLEDCLKRPLTDAWGINKAVESHLKFLGINNLLELKKYSPDKIRMMLGRYGYYLWANVNGQEISKVNCGNSIPKSVGHSYCLPKKTNDKKYLESIVFKLVEKIGRRLRSLEMEGAKINFYMAYIREGGINKSFRPGYKIFTTEEIFLPVSEFLKNVNLLFPVSMIAISVSSLSQVSAQISLFYNSLKKKDLSRAMDKINDKYGEYAVIYGAMFGTENSAHDRIGFRKTVNIND